MTIICGVVWQTSIEVTFFLSWRVYNSNAAGRRVQVRLQLRDKFNSAAQGDRQVKVKQTNFG